jgi:pyridoxamine 5'-phosphate oxidase
LHFYTNYLSSKGNQIEYNNQVALLFFWPELERQVRFVGVATKVSESESDEYFNSRPFESRVGAIISPQSQVITDRTKLETAYKKLIENPDSNSLKRPDHWGGYAVIITEAEFWQGRPGRMHDRIRFRSENNNWIKERLAP